MTTAQKLLTAEDLLAMPDDGRRCELIRGELIEMPPPSVLHGIVTGRIGYRISSFIEERGIRFVYGPEIGIFLGQGPDTVRAADFCVIAAARMTSPLPTPFPQPTQSMPPPFFAPRHRGGTVPQHPPNGAQAAPFNIHRNGLGLPPAPADGRPRRVHNGGGSRRSCKPADHWRTRPCASGWNRSPGSGCGDGKRGGVP